MKRWTNPRLFAALILVFPLSAYLASQNSPDGARAVEPAPIRYYITTKAMLIDPEVVSIFGASNLPPGSVLLVYIYDYIGEGSKVFNEETRVRMGEDGLFKVTIQPKEGLKFFGPALNAILRGELVRPKDASDFGRSMVCSVSFSPNYPPQPESVIKVVGDAGENLGSNATNPQIAGNSRVTDLQNWTVVTE